ncbi:plasmid mobilization protein [Streptomyces sp. NBC_01794]|uniref:plasmid mobilization protein n=1 Tax=Streptomyces sp. NBC_01794 TaxID=2975942 RepID=UPI00387348F3
MSLPSRSPSVWGPCTAALRGPVLLLSSPRQPRPDGAHRDSHDRRIAPATGLICHRSAPYPPTDHTPGEPHVHDRHHEYTNPRETPIAPDNRTASWRFGHSPAGGALEPDPAPGVAGPVCHQGAPDGKAATEGGPQPGTASPKGKARQGRPRLRDKKQRRAHSVRLSAYELAIIESGAEHVGLSVAGFLAHSGLAAARDQSRTAITIATERDVLTELFAMRRQLGWAGSNLNQVAKVLNSGGDVPYLMEVLADVHRAAQAAKKAVDRVANPQEGEAA